MRAWAWCDGSNGRSAGHSGAAAYVIADADTKELIEEQVEMYAHPDPATQRWTCNDMEMTAIYLCVQASLRLGVANLKIHSDSEWAVNIILGTYKLSKVKFQSILDDIHRLGADFENIEILHIPRDLNKRADHLCSVATGQPRALARPPSIIWDTKISF